MSEPLRPTVEQIAAARLRVVLDQRSGRSTLPIVEEWAQMTAPDEDVVTSDPPAGSVVEPASAPAAESRIESQSFDRRRLRQRARRTQSVAGTRTSAMRQPERSSLVTSPELELNAREREVLKVIRNSVERFGYPPSVRDIGVAVGLASTSSVAYVLRALERKGFLRRDPNRPRAVGVLPADTELPAEVEAKPRPVDVPVVGRIAAGDPVLDDVAIEEVFSLPREIVGDGDLFLLRVTGDSMIDAGIADGDWAVVRQQSTVGNGAIIAAMIDGNPAVTTYQRRDGHVWLQPQNPAYEPVSADDATILGTVVAILRRL